MSLVRRITHDRSMAFGKIQQSIREDDLWTAAWCMSKFLRTPHVLSASERQWLQEEYTYRMNRVRDAVNLFERIARQHAADDFYDWLEMGNPFALVEEESFKKHEKEASKLLQEIKTYSRSAGYLRAIINMKVGLASPQDGEVFELEAMGPSPGLKKIEK